MKKKPSRFIAGLRAILLLSVFFTVVLWTLFPLGGETLPHRIEAGWHLSFMLAAFLVSLSSGVIGVGAIFALHVMPKEDVSGEGQSEEEAP